MNPALFFEHDVDTFRDGVLDLTFAKVVYFVTWESGPLILPALYFLPHTFSLNNKTLHARHIGV